MAQQSQEAVGSMRYFRHESSYERRIESEHSGRMVAEACQHGINGWQFGNGFTHQNPAVQDEHDTKALYRILNDAVIPTYYHDRPKWVEMMRNSITSTRHYFDIKRMMDKYYERMYTAQRKNL